MRMTVISISTIKKMDEINDILSGSTEQWGNLTQNFEIIKKMKTIYNKTLNNKIYLFLNVSNEYHLFM